MGLLSTPPGLATATGSGPIVSSDAFVAGFIALFVVAVVAVVIAVVGAARGGSGAGPSDATASGSRFARPRVTPQARADRARARYAARHPPLPAVVTGTETETRLRELLAQRDRGDITPGEYTARRADVTRALRDGPDRTAP